MLMVLAFLLISNTNALMRFLYVDTILLHSTHKCVPEKKKIIIIIIIKTEGCFACTHAEESFTNCQVSMVRHSFVGGTCEGGGALVCV